MIPITRPLTTLTVLRIIAERTKLYVGSLRLMLRLYRRARLLGLPFDVVLYQHLLWTQEKLLDNIQREYAERAAEAAVRN